MTVLSLLLTILVYRASRHLYAKRSWLILSPILVSPLLLGSMLLLGKVDYSRYMDGAQWLSALLGPATVALAVPMYKYRKMALKHSMEMGVGVLLGSFVALVSSVLPATWLHWSPALVGSLAPRSVTTPIAMELAGSMGGEPVMAAAFVVITGVFGMAVGPLLIRMLNLRSAVARGALLGMGAHGAGTARAFEYGDLEGTAASLSMIAAAFVTLALAPLLMPLLWT